MNSATTLALDPRTTDRRDRIESFYGDIHASFVQAFHETMNQGVWKHYCKEDGSSLSTQLVNRRCVIQSHSGTTDYEVTLIQYGEGSDSLIIFDFNEPASEFPEEHQEVIDYLRSGGRRILAGKLIAMLRNVEEDPDNPLINIVSLWDMARILAAHKDFADPFIGPDGRGNIHAQWRILGDGVLVVSFLGYGVILLVAQADEGSDNDVLDISVRGPEQDILEDFGRLVPRRR